MIEVELSDGRVVEFPDGTPQNVMRDALSRVPEPKGETPFSGLGAMAKMYQGATDLPYNALKFMQTFGKEGDELEQTQEKFDEWGEGREAFTDKYADGTSDLWRMAGQVVGGGASGGPAMRGGSILKGAAERIGNTALESAMFSVGAGGDEADAATDAGIGAAIASPIEAITGGIRGIKSIPKAVRKVLPMSDEARAADDFAASRGVPIAGEDLVQNNIVRSTGRALDAVDPSNFRNRQLSSMKESFESEMLAPFARFDDPIAEMGDSFKRQYDAVNDKSSALYKQSFEELNPLGPMPADQLRNDLLNLHDEAVRVLGPDSKEAKEIARWFDYGDANIEDWVTRRKKLGRDIRKAERSTDADTVDLKTMRDIRGLVDNAIDSFGGQNSKYRDANKYFRENVVPYRKEAYKKGVAKGAQADNLEKSVKDALSGTPTAQTRQRFDEVWSSLDARGRDAYRQSLLDQIMEAATNPETGFSPDRAATMMDRLKNRLGEDVLGPEMARAMDGWNNLFRQSGFAAEQAARSRTGASITQIGAPVAILSGAAPLAALTPLMPALIARSRRARQILAKLADMKPDHPDYQTVVQDLMTEAGRFGGRAQAVNQEQ